KKFDSNFESKEKLRDSTLVFLIKKSQEKVTEICLAMKKRGFGMNRWNGVGGKVEKDETMDSAAEREAQEEIGVEIKQTNKVAELSFYFPHNPTWNQKVHVYFSEVWGGEPEESEEMKPQWFKAENLPFEHMWPDDEFWVPEVLSGKLVKATFVFGEGDVIQSKNVKIVDSL
ncbi:MAG: 8-oxo-dGTP diphosphatase, partial [Patescibacteria group bacterium]